MRTVRFIFLLVFAFAPAYQGAAEGFAPTPLRISTQQYVHYEFAGTPLSFPFQVSGAPAEAVFLIFTSDKKAAIKGVRNGYLGWHFVNKIDTCIYLSSPFPCGIGGNTFTWSGKDEADHVVPAGTYAYYLWGYDRISPGVKATNFISSRRFAGAQVVTRGGDGKPLAEPRIFDALPASVPYDQATRVVRGKWVIGGDPENPALMETTAYMTAGEVPRLATDPREPGRYFFTESAQPDTVTLWKRGWVPNGDAEILTDWGNNGEVTYPSSHYPFQPYFGGPATDGAEMLFFPYVWPIGDAHTYPSIDSGVACVNVLDGTLVKKIAPPDWSSPPDAVYCPDTVEYRNGMLFVTRPMSCLVQMIDPSAENAADLLRWENGLGDGIWDKSLSPDSFQRTWACFGAFSPPNPAGISPDANFFSLFPATGLPGASFGLFAPDGTGIGNFTIPGMENGNMYGLHAVDANSAYDGLYYSGATDSLGVLWRGCDSANGILSSSIDFLEASVSPRSFVAISNHPNPFNPSTTIRCELGMSGRATLSVYNTLGQLVRKHNLGRKEKGTHEFLFDGSGLTSGVYFYRVNAGNASATGRMVLIR